MLKFQNAYKDKVVLITGHTGFKGSWLGLWLSELGAKVHGIALDPPSPSNLFNTVCSVFESDLRQDITVGGSVDKCVQTVQPDFVFHLAAQPLVIESYKDPVGTLNTNVMGTAHVLESVRKLSKPCHIVVVTTDKCYLNQEWLYSYRETDPLGGHDLYSASKAAVEIITTAYNRSFFEKDPTRGRVASARGGNVIGGGDWAENRIVPDIMRSLSKGEKIRVRNPLATRPWQHVLDCLSGYLTLGSWLASDRSANSSLRAFNFGPTTDCERSVKDLVEAALSHWPGEWIDQSDPAAVHEATRLSISIDLANSALNWRPSWDFSQTVEHTVNWYKKAFGNSDPSQLLKLMRDQLVLFSADAKIK